MRIVKERDVNSLDYVEAMNRQHESEREREWAARFRQDHPEVDIIRDNRWAGFFHRWAARASHDEATNLRPRR